MCGFVGLMGSSGGQHETLAILKSMSDRIVSRGPDDYGVWVDEVGIGLAHRRLSILDLSPAGKQPMVSSCGRYVIALNGEIYNHLDLRVELEKLLTSAQKFAWRGHSDTEVLLEGISVWGVKASVERCIGMFAFAVWDKKERTLTLGRDRMGEKPLYYGWHGSGCNATFLFGSDLSALKAHPKFIAEIDRNALCLLMRYSYIPAPYSIYKTVNKLPPGSLLTVSLNQREPAIDTYWSLTDVAVSGNNSLLSGSTEKIVGDLETLLMSAVGQQMMADVPLGAFLSGGVDSSTVVALMQSQSNRPVKTFSIGFNEVGYDEALHAKAVARHLGTDHTELYVTPQDALNVIPKLPLLYSEPFADSSQVPTFLVSQLAREKVTVSLSGDGGDELFAGYNRYLLTQKIWNRISTLSHKSRKSISSVIRAISPSAWNTLLDPLQPLFPGSWRQTNIGDKLHKGAGILPSRNVDELYLGLLTHWNPKELVLGGLEPTTYLSGNTLSLDSLNDVQRMMALDAITYLPDDILVKVDRAAMGVSLEGRVPFLDHRVVEFAWRVPQSLKIRDGVGKWVLREVLYRHVPKELIERPKMGFGVPIDSWLRGPLKVWSEELLNEGRLRREGYFNVALVRQKWTEHLSGNHNWQYPLWDILMFQQWLEMENK